jgi:hypothetical protein
MACRRTAYDLVLAAKKMEETSTDMEGCGERRCGMSYDIDFRVKVEGIDHYVSVGDCDANITWNAREIITRSTGLPWINEDNNGLCKEVIPHIELGLAELKNHPEEYRKYEAPNGWGTVEGTIHFFERILKAWRDFKRWEDKILVDVTTFWIV